MNIQIFLLVFAIYWSNQINGDDEEVEPTDISFYHFQAITSRLYHARSFQVHSLDQSFAYFKYNVVYKSELLS